MIPFLRYKKAYFFFSGTLILASLICLAVFGLKPGIDFTGGSILEVNYIDERPSSEEIKSSLASLDLGEARVQFSGETRALIRMKDISEDVHQQVVTILKNGGELEELRFEMTGPVIGEEMKQKTALVILLVILAILIYITFAFRKVSRPVVSWKYGIVSLIALFHDVLIPLGIFSVLGNFFSVEITIPIVTAFLIVLGYSINDSVVVFDRVRENLNKNKNILFEKIVDNSLNQTLTRSINTSFTTLLVLFAIFFFGGDTLKYFSLALILGLICGTYSSIFLASPLLAGWREKKSA